jgi:hypothetical protein
LQIAQDPKRSADDRAAYRDIAEELSFGAVALQDPNTTPANKAYFKAQIELISDALIALQKPKGPPKPPAEQKKIQTGVKKAIGALKAIQNPNTKPKDPKDQEAIKQIVEKNSRALVTVQNPDAPEDERNEAQATVDQLDGASQDSQYQEFLQEVKRLGASTACIDSIENRTDEAGWPEGSLWGLSDPSCARTVTAGASGEGKWKSLFECVGRNPFSECVGTVPKE